MGNLTMEQIKTNIETLVQWLEVRSRYYDLKGNNEIWAILQTAKANLQWLTYYDPVAFHDYVYMDEEMGGEE